MTNMLNATLILSHGRLGARLARSLAPRLTKNKKCFVAQYLFVLAIKDVAQYLFVLAIKDVAQYLFVLAIKDGEAATDVGPAAHRRRQ